MVTPRAADMAVLSLLGPRLAEERVLDALGLDVLPAEWLAVPLAGGRIVRRMPDGLAGQIELDVVVKRGDRADWQRRLTQAGVRPAGIWAYEAHRVAHRVPARRPRLGVDTDERTILTKWVDRWPRRRSRPPEQGLLPRARDRRTGAQPG